LQAIESGAAFRAVAEHVGYAELTEVRRQRTDWQRAATKELATARTADALARYADAGMLEQVFSDDDARDLLVERWHDASRAAPDASRIMLAHSRADVRALNERARIARQEAGQLGPDMKIETSRGDRAFAAGDRLLFLRNERNLGVKNGTLGTIAGLKDGSLMVRTDDGRTVAVDPSTYKDLDHGYATTIHKAQGVTVDEAFVLATRGFDRHLTYVAASRHRTRMTMVWSRESFGGEAHLFGVLGRERAMDTTLDYREAPVLQDDRQAEIEAALLARADRLERRSPIGERPSRDERGLSIEEWAERMIERTRERGVRGWDLER
jgi:hypothetical protein